MKKILSILTLVLTLSLTACDTSEKSEYQLNSDLINHAVISSTQVVVDREDYSFFLDLKNYEIHFNASVKLSENGSAQSFKTGTMTLNYDSQSGYYKFSASSVSASGAFSSITDVNGIIDTETNICKVSYKVNGATVTATLGELYYQYNNTLVKHPENEDSVIYTHSNAIYDFVVTSGTAAIYSIKFGADSTQYTRIQVKGLDVTATPTGYTLSGTELPTTVYTPNSSAALNGSTMHSFVAHLTFSGNVFDIAYQYGDIKATASGTMFSTSGIY